MNVRYITRGKYLQDCWVGERKQELNGWFATMPPVGERAGKNLGHPQGWNLMKYVKK